MTKEWDGNCKAGLSIFKSFIWLNGADSVCGGVGATIKNDSDGFRIAVTVIFGAVMLIFGAVRYVFGAATVNFGVARFIFFVV